MEQYNISLGRSRKDTDWAPRQTTWEKLCEKCSKVRKTHESLAEYRSMTKAGRARIKDVGGFMGGALSCGHRKACNVISRSLLTLDIDYGTADTIDLVADALFGTAWCLYSTHSHTKESPRYRLIIPLSRDVTPDEYGAISRRIAEIIGISLFDDSTYQPERLMYWPSCSRDADFVFMKENGEPCQADEILETYTDWRDVSQWPVSPRVTKLAQGRGAKQEDPTEKPGLIGAFCRSWKITEAIAKFLPDVYTETLQPDRWTYTDGTTSGGLVIYEDKWAYSHHGTDPASGKLCNAFDLVRLHLFGAQDDDAEPDSPVNRLPSFLAMEQLINKDERTTGLLAQEVFRDINGDLDMDTDNDWLSELRMDDRHKNFLATPDNFGIIMANDPQLKDAVSHDAFRSKDLVVADLPWRKAEESSYWTNADACGLIDYVSKTYRIASKQALLDAFELATSRRAFHPVRDYLNALEWDGIERLDTMLIDYLGARDSELTRAMTRKHLVAAVARVMQPGIKYDYVLTFVGPEGIGKSMLIKHLGSEWFDDSITSIEGKDAMEQLRGKWLIEMGELTNYKRSTSEAYKAFLSKTEDSYRPAYGRFNETYDRQCVFFATTNEYDFLKGSTGNRRFWVVDCGLCTPTKSVFDDLKQERDQIWAEAVHRYRQHEPLYLNAKFEAEARKHQESHNELEADDRRGMIEDFIGRKLPQGWADMSTMQRIDYLRLGAQLPGDEATETRQYITAMEIYLECMGQRADEKTRYKTKEINQILKSMPQLEYVGLKRCRPYGPQRTFRIKADDEL